MTDKKNVYVIVEIGYEYNDEYYYRTEHGGGSPVKYYKSKKEATEACDKMNEKARKTVDSQDYTSPGEDVVDIEELMFYEVVEVPLG